MPFRSSPSWLCGYWCTSAHPWRDNGSTSAFPTLNYTWVCTSAPVAIKSSWWRTAGYVVLVQYIYIKLIVVIYVKLWNSNEYAIYFCDYVAYTFETPNRYIYIWCCIKSKKIFSLRFLIYITDMYRECRENDCK